ncbi:protein FAM204A isoform X4 [Myiozetetes cayanensis]|uniref:protein FAM204A isoform X3 n=1 Tax=Myiozetetes cayanensis TaxID=478635 RepID=UPI002160A989|nr:protein FAM204A isoform X3 [Myiozetetes cayanensis]XP_050196836.1 protein FAM204A isoform X4 [Myiozetetes cayanensis]
MWSGLLPPGVNESDVDSSSDGADDSPASSWKKGAPEDTEGAQLSELLDRSGQGSSASSEPVVAPLADEESECQTCPPGVSVHIWNKFVELQKKHREMKMEAQQENRCRKRKRHRKAKQTKADEVTKRYNQVNVTVTSQQLENEEKWKELTQYFGINDRFESPVHSRAPQKSGLELSIERCVAEGDIAKAEELSDRLAMRELGVKIAKAAACRNFVKAKQEAEAAQEAQKKKKLAWGFEAKKRWETKSNMGYM